MCPGNVLPADCLPEENQGASFARNLGSSAMAADRGGEVSLLGIQASSPSPLTSLTASVAADRGTSHVPEFYYRILLGFLFRQWLSSACVGRPDVLYSLTPGLRHYLPSREGPFQPAPIFHVPPSQEDGSVCLLIVSFSHLSPS